MSDNPLATALERLDRAARRIERAAAQAPAPAVAPPALALAFADLDERHGLLRLRVQETIEQLDALIAGAAASRDPAADAV